MIGKIEIDTIKSRVDQAVGKRDLLTRQLESVQLDITNLEKYVEDCQKARAVVTAVAEDTQKKIEFQISNIVSLALSSVFPDPYEFKLQFVTRRNKIEADLIFIKNGNEGKPTEIAGGGSLDVASFALKTAIWAIKPTNNVMILDEPFHFLSRNLQSKCSEMIKMINRKMGLQFIIVSHIIEIAESADKIFNVTNKNGIATVESSK